MNNKIEYNIGLDIGTNSVGWAVIDNNYNIIRKGKHPLWGVRLFEEANSAFDRRMKRATRRRFDRRRERIRLLQEEFNNEINKVDPDFFNLLKESFLFNEDRSSENIKIDQIFKLKATKYYQEFPTIYHLRNKLTTSNDKMDIRLVYLAIHHIIKYRGNFLREGEKFKVSELNLNESIIELFDLLFCSSNVAIKNDNIDYNEFMNILLLSNKLDKKKGLDNFFKNIFDDKSFYGEFVKLLIGNQCDLAKMFSIESDEPCKINFNGGEDFDVQISKAENILGKMIDIIYAVKKLYDDVYLKLMFNSDSVNSISSLKIKIYEEHKEHKNLLKEIFRGTDAYKKIFKGDNCLYNVYLSKKDKNEFIKALNNLVEDISDEKKKKFNEKILPLFEYDFMPLTASTDNGKYPYQLNEDELVKIIENQGKFYPFLLDKTDDEYKIITLLKFRIPYYVGPLGKFNNKNYWMIRNEHMNNEKITPYNFNKVVNLDESAKVFIERMTSNCTYLLKEKAIPAESILYSKFKVLNEIKQITINGESLDLMQQSLIYQNLFLKRKGTITNQIFKDFIIQNQQFFAIPDKIEIKGYSANNAFANNMKSYLDFFGDDGIFVDTGYKEEDAEEIIRLITTLEDKKILERCIRNLNKYDDSLIGKFMKLKYKKWSNLSKKLLTELAYYDKSESQSYSIIQLMENTTNNFIQIINNRKYGFAKLIAKENADLGKENINDIVYELPTSPQNKRGIIQAIKIVKAIVKKMGYEPKNISIEMARSEEEKKRTKSRKDTLSKIYEELSADKLAISGDEFSQLLADLKNMSNDTLRIQKYYLYFIQGGRSLYSARTLDIENLDETTEIDHILPQSLVKDNSLDNLALVLKEENQIKSGDLVVPSQFRNNPKTKKLWGSLHKCGLLSEKKKNRLERSFYDDKAKAGFINRQLVETRQITKHVANILNNYYRDTNIIYLSAQLSSEYRNRYELFKYRDLNDLHHAHDAYLSIALGLYKEKYFNQKIDQAKLEDVSQLMKSNEDVRRILRYGYIINSMDNEYCDRFCSCSKEQMQYINSKIQYNLYRNDISVSYKAFDDKSRLFKERLHKKTDKSSTKYPIKKGLNPENYGFYSDLDNSYFVVVQYKNENRIIIIPSIVNENDLKSYIATIKYKVDESKIEILNKHIYKNSLIMYDNDIVRISGGRNKSCEIKSTFQLKFSKDSIDKYALNYVINDKKPVDYSDDKIIVEFDRIVEKIAECSMNYNLIQNQLESFINVYNSLISVDDKKKCIKNIISLCKGNDTSIARYGDRSITNFKIINSDILGFNKKMISYDEA